MLSYKEVNKNKERLAKQFVLKFGVKNYYNESIRKNRLQYYLLLVVHHFKIKSKNESDQLLELYRLNPYGLIERFKERKKKINKSDFYMSDAWRTIRKQVLLTYGDQCMKCKRTKLVTHVDHIKPRSLFPELELDFDNLQVLCKKCNIKKSNTDQTDYRPKPITFESKNV